MDLRDTGKRYTEDERTLKEDTHWQKKLMSTFHDGTVWASDHALIKVFPTIQMYKFVDTGINMKVVNRIREIYKDMNWKELQ